MSEKPFSKRHGFKAQGGEIKIRNDAPEEFRDAAIQIAIQLEFSYMALREVVCTVLLTVPDPNNWTEIPNVRDEVVDLVHSCLWFKVYDIAEYLYRFINERRHLGEAERYQETLNDFFIERGYGWKMENGVILTRGNDSFETHIKEVVEILDASGLVTSKKEIKEAINDISKRPEPDITGAITHSIGSLECVCREITGNQKLTLGELIKNHPKIVPKPLDEAIIKIWGFSSEMARHIREGRSPGFEEAELIVGLTSAIITYLLKKVSSK